MPNIVRNQSSTSGLKDETEQSSSKPNVNIKQNFDGTDAKKTMGTDETNNKEENSDTNEGSVSHSLDVPLRVNSRENPRTLANEARSWTARRVDLIISPYSQYYYALVGWIGSKQFNRDIRTYAEREMNMKLSSHGLYDFTQVDLPINL